MIRHEIVRPPEFVYPIEEWKMVEKRFYPRFLPQAETIFSVGNGYLGMRGNFEEGRPVFQSGTFVNGFYESWPIVYGEEAYGFAKTGQTIVNVPDGKIIKLYVDDEPLFLPTADLLDFERTLDMKAGTLDRRVLWETPAGKRVLIESRRLVSFQHRHLAAISYRVTVLNARAPVIISSQLINMDIRHTEEFDPRKARGFKERPLVPQGSYANDRRLVLSYMTRNSKMTLACGAEHQIETQCPYSYQSECSDDIGKVVFSVDALPGEPVNITKYLTYHTSRSAPPRELADRAERTLDRAVRQGFEELVEGQREYLDDFWRRSDVQVESDPAFMDRPEGEFQQAIRWNLLQIFQAGGRAEGVGVPAKGLTGQTYEGHYFWDTEIYVLPFLIYTAPRIARNLLRFRHSMLDKARDRARELREKGALFPWRTINGEEASAYYAAGTAQYHINADIMYALKKYVDATGDEEFLFDEGVEMLVETARMWYDLGFFSERKGGRFCIHAVTGPDEYTTVVDNNTYTNLMARLNLRFAATTVEALRSRQPDSYQALCHKTGLQESEAAQWKRAADHMHIPYDDEAGIHLQDSRFLERELWDFENTPAEHYPLLLHHHPLTIYRHQVIKQADIVLAMFLLGDEFSEDAKRRNFDYYDPLTTGDSSLSACIQSIAAAEIGYMDKAMEYGRYAVLMDLADVGQNVSDGCHIASMGGTWMVLVYGFAGMRDYDGHLTFRPRLPKELKALRFPLSIKGRTLDVAIDRESATYTLRAGPELVISHWDEEVTLAEGTPISKKLPPSHG
ncbi:MAG: glycoside hydrolase family 65 protein [Anaerolineales bacterium]|nr:glycoside hydrolase family 65 protein [Anaerolineales bacterium]